MRTFDKGTVSELEVQLHLVKMGYQVFTPVNEGCRVDLVFIDDAGIPKKVQVKKASKTACGFVIELRYNLNRYRTGKGLYTSYEIDYFATVWEDQLYLIPMQDVVGKTRVVLRFDSKYKNQNAPMYAKNYELKP